MNYQAEWEQAALDNLRKMDASVAQRILVKINWLIANLDKIKPIALRGPLKNYFKLVIGDYRVIYSISRSKSMVVIHIVGHRSSVYKLDK
jgi:mRNA interferase RelE/StbE